MFQELIVLSNKRLACACTYAVKLMLLCSVLVSHALCAQDTVSFKDVEISARKTELAQIGKKVEEVDSTAREQFRFSSVADLLGYNSAVFIKTYGPGAVASTALRGGNASQTALLWNGFNLQNAMLGQADLALMPSVLFDNIAVEYGGSSSLWGSGAMGGSIHLDNRAAFGQGLISRINLGGGSFGALNGSASVLASGQRFVSSTKLYSNTARNNFSYRDTLDKEEPLKRRKDAEYNFKGLLQEFRFLVGKKQLISLNAWLNTNQRHLPTFNNGESKAFQTDEAARFSASWTYTGRSFKSVARAGYFMDVIDYRDSASAIYSNSKVKTFMLENENYFDLSKNNQLNVAVNALSSNGTTENYSGVRTISRASLLLGDKFTFFENKLTGYLSARAEYFSVGTLPVTGNASLEYKLHKNITAKINAARVYRQPTLNELYWVPGGNPDLKPEQGYTYEGELEYTKQIKNFSFHVSGAAYSRTIDNWILWTPGPNNSSVPRNVQEVWSRGTETSWKIAYQKKKIRAGIRLMTTYVLSTVRSNGLENDNTVDKQLIYTPRYTVNGQVILGYAATELVYYHQYSGYRFTTSDNLSWLDPYHVSSLRLSYKWSHKEYTVSLFGACNNFFNTSYTILAGQPMALRNYELGISIQARSSFKTDQTKNQ